MDAQQRKAVLEQLRLTSLMVELQTGKLLARQHAWDELCEGNAAVNAQARQVNRACRRRRERAARSGAA